MVECENCGDNVPEIWRYRKFSGTTTHRRVTWVCRECHPSIATSARSTTDTPRAVADGGAALLGCPMCGGSTIDGQGLSACTECSWSGTREGV